MRWMLWAVLGVIIAIWLFGVITDVIGGLIHLVLVLAVVAAAAMFLKARDRG